MLVKIMSLFSCSPPNRDVFPPFVLESFGSIHIERRKFLAKLQHRARHFYSQAMKISNPKLLALSVYYARILSPIVHVDFAHSIETVRKSQVSIDNTSGRIPDLGNFISLMMIFLVCILVAIFIFFAVFHSKKKKKKKKRSE
jgi:hypothetical protein